MGDDTPIVIVNDPVEEVLSKVASGEADDDTPIIILDDPVEELLSRVEGDASEDSGATESTPPDDLLNPFEFEIDGDGQQEAGAPVAGIARAEASGPFDLDFP